MPTFRLDSKYLLGILPLDRQHQELMEMCAIFQDDIHKESRPEHQKKLCLDFLNQMHNQLTLHVLSEEKYMIQLQYPKIRFIHHKNIHRDLLALFRQLHREIEAEGCDPDMLNRLNGLAVGGLQNHILTADRYMDLYEPNIRPYPEIGFFEYYNHTISGLMAGLLGPDGRTRLLIREYYGENLGKAVYLRQVYSSFFQDSQITIFSAYSADFLLQSARSMFSDPSLPFSPMLFSIAEELSSIYMWQVVFPMLPHPDSSYRLTESRFLPYLDFHSSLQEKPPSLSSLFITNALGSFALGVHHHTPEKEKLNGFLHWASEKDIREKNAVLP